MFTICSKLNIWKAIVQSSYTAKNLEIVTNPSPVHSKLPGLDESPFIVCNKNIGTYFIPRAAFVFDTRTLVSAMNRKGKEPELELSEAKCQDYGLPNMQQYRQHNQQKRSHLSANMIRESGNFMLL